MNSFEDSSSTPLPVRTGPQLPRATVAFDPTPPLAADVLALFRGQFADVCFPDVDRDSLDVDASALLACQAQVESLEHALEQARQETKAAASHLAANAERALAYAKVFAMGQPELEAALAEVRAVRGESTTKERAPKKRRAARASASVQLPIHASPELQPEGALRAEAEAPPEDAQAAE